MVERRRATDTDTTGRRNEEAVREEGESSHWLPAEASAIALVRERGGGAWAAGVAVGLADIIGRRRGHTFLANTVPGPGELDGLMEACELPGLTRALSGDVPVSRIARSAPRQSFAFLPAGTPALALSRLREVPGFQRLPRKLAERGGTLLIYVAEEELLEGGAPDPERVLPVDGCIAIGDVEDPALIVGAPLLARVERPAGERAGRAPGAGADGAEAAGARATIEGNGDDSPAAAPATAGAPGRRRRRRLAWIAAAVGVVALGAWALSLGPEDGGEVARDEEAVAAGVAPATGTAAAGSGREGTSAERAGGEGARGPATPPELAAPELPYSVLVASFARPEDAARQMRQLAASDVGWIVAPTPIRGRLYWRILAGAREDRAGGERLMDTLVVAGNKESVRSWDVRPVRLAWLVGVHAGAGEARDAVRRLEAKGIPAYVLDDGGDETRFHAVYAGAFESEEAATPMGELLSDAGETARLVTRRGRPR
ncbi:MAG: SPOR domain-containing protein [Gemmatimonadota bacterium]